MGVKPDPEDSTTTELGRPIVRIDKQAGARSSSSDCQAGRVRPGCRGAGVEQEFAVGKILVLRGASHQQDPQKFCGRRSQFT